MVGAALYLAAVGLLGVALGWLLRHTAAAISTLFGVLLILPLLARALPSPWSDDVSKWLPSGAGQALWARRTEQRDVLGSQAPVVGGRPMGEHESRGPLVQRLARLRERAL